MLRRQATTLRQDAPGLSSRQRGDTFAKALRSIVVSDNLGFCLLNASNRVIGADAAATRLLNYPQSARTRLNASCVRDIQELASRRQRADGPAWCAYCVRDAVDMCVEPFR
jgi:hypothetical protein